MTAYLYYIISYYIISYYIILCYIISYHITAHHMISRETQGWRLGAMVIREEGGGRMADHESETEPTNLRALGF